MYNVNTVYPAFQGEVNAQGIGAPVIFLRLQGCHLRCYQSTFGTLCDTPEGLEGKGGRYLSLSELMAEVNTVSRIMGGVKYVCLTGGDPLWRNPTHLKALFTVMDLNGYQVSVETSGTLSIRPYAEFPNVSWVLDYKTRSAGIKQKFIWDDISCLSEKDFIKFVLYDTADYTEFTEVLPRFLTKARIAVGTYWGGELQTMSLYNRLLNDGLLGKVTLNVQLHKLAFFTDAHWDQIQNVAIPAEI